MPHEAVKRQQATMRLRIEENGGGFAVGPRSQEMKDRIREIAKSRPEAEWRPKMEAAWEARRNQEITDEMRETYRQARIKYMTENPGTLVDTAGERQIREWLESKSIAYRQQWTLKPYGHPYDFFLPDFTTLIEFDGTHHWDRIWFNVSGKTDSEKSQLLLVQQEKDAQENWEAGKKGFKIIRLWGWTKIGDAPGLPSFEEQMKIQGWQDF